MYCLAKMYEEGIGVKVDYTEAFTYYDLAAKHKHFASMVKVGLMCLKGIGCSKNIAQSVLMFSLASEAGNPDAQYELAKLYAVGNGVPQDNQQAYIWSSLALACGKGDSEIAKFRDEISKNLTTTQLNDAQCETSLYFENYQNKREHIIPTTFY